MFRKAITTMLVISISLLCVACGNEEGVSSKGIEDSTLSTSDKTQEHDNNQMSLSDYLESADYAKALEIAADNQKQDVYAENTIACAISKWLQMEEKNEPVILTGLGKFPFSESYRIKDITEGYVGDDGEKEYAYIHFNGQLSDSTIEGYHVVFYFTDNETAQFIMLNEIEYNNGVERTADTSNLSNDTAKQIVENTVKSQNDALRVVNSMKKNGYKLGEESIARLNKLLSTDKLASVVKLKAEMNNNASPSQSQETATLTKSKVSLSSDSSLPKKVNYMYNGEIRSTMEVTDISYSISEASSYLHIQVKAKLTYSSKGDNKADTGWVGYRLLDSNNEVVDTGAVLYSDLRVGDVMTQETIIDLKTDEPKQYYLELVDKE